MNLTSETNDSPSPSQIRSSGLHFVNETKLLYSSGERDVDSNKANNHDSSSSEDNYLTESPNHENSIKPGKKTRGRVKIETEFIKDKVKRYTTFSKRKTGIMKKAYELSKLTGTQLMLLVASETGHVYTFATKKLKPMIESVEGKAWIEACITSENMFTSDVHKKRTYNFVKNNEMEDDEKPGDRSAESGLYGHEDSENSKKFDVTQPKLGTYNFEPGSDVMSSAAPLKLEYEKTSSDCSTTPMDLSKRLNRRHQTSSHIKRPCYSKDVKVSEHLDPATSFAEFCRASLSSINQTMQGVPDAFTVPDNVDQHLNA